MFTSSLDAQTVIFQDDFSRTPTPQNEGSALAGTSPVIGAAYATDTYGTVFAATTAGDPESLNAAYTIKQLHGEDLLYLGSGGDMDGPHTTYGQTVFSTTTPGKDSVAVTFDFLKFNNKTGEVHIQSFSNATGTDGLGFDIKLMANGQIAVNSGSGYIIIAEGRTLGGDVESSFSLTADYSTMTFHASVSNNTATLDFEGSLNTGATEFGSLVISSTTSPNTRSDAAAFYLDNLLVTTTSPINK